MTEHNKIDLKGITFHDVPIDECVDKLTCSQYIAEQDVKETIKEEIQEKKNKNPIHIKEKYKFKRFERNGKVMNITNEVKNQNVIENYKKSKTIRHLIVATLLQGGSYTCNGILNTIMENKNFDPSSLVHIVKGVLDIKQIQNNIYLLCSKTELGQKYLIKELSNKNIHFPKQPNIYSLTKEGLNLTFEEAIELAKENPQHSKRLRSEKQSMEPIIRRPIREVFVTKKEFQELKDEVNDIKLTFSTDFSKSFDEAIRYVDHIKETLEHNFNFELHNQLTKAINELMQFIEKDKIVTITNQNPSTIKVDIPTDFKFHFNFTIGDK
ncbi:MAG: hypothetical protein FK734_03710 [Asgard group archaeon]|nr:hypothetical protein [Asgard group archaeon]